MIIIGQYAGHLNQSVVVCHDIFRDMRLESENTSESPLESGNYFFISRQLQVVVGFPIL
jgi:hypothetical protein